MVCICIQQYKTSVNIVSGNGPAVFVQLPVLQKSGYITQSYNRWRDAFYGSEGSGLTGYITTRNY